MVTESIYLGSGNRVPDAGSPHPLLICKSISIFSYEPSLFGIVHDINTQLKGLQTLKIGMSCGIEKIIHSKFTMYQEVPNRRERGNKLNK